MIKRKTQSCLTLRRETEGAHKCVRARQGQQIPEEKKSARFSRRARKEHEFATRLLPFLVFGIFGTDN